MRIWLPYVVAGSGTDTFTESFAESLRDEGHDAITHKYPHWIQYAPDLLSASKPPDGTELVFTNSWNGFAFKNSDLPMVTMEQLCVHDPDYRKYKSPIQSAFHNSLVRWFESRTFRSADRVVAVSRATRDAVKQVFPWCDPIVIPNGVDTGFFTPSPGPRQSNTKFTMLFVGNLTKRKGADLLAPVMENLGEAFVLRYTSGLRVKSRAEIPHSVALGKLNREKVRDEYRSADVLILPTRLEGLPLVVLEAMSCGLPIVGSDRTSMPEAVDDGENGFLRPLDSNELAEAVRQLADNPQRHETMSQNARRKAVEEFDMAQTTSRYLELFEELLSRG